MRTTEQLIGDLASSDNDTQVQAESALISMGESVVGLLIEATRRSNSQVRWRAAWSLGQIGEHRAFEAVAALLDDPEKEVRHEATEALGHLGDSRAISLLVGIIRRAEEDVETALHASHYAAMFGSQAVPELAHILNSGSPTARMVAAYALGNTGAKEAIELLTPHLDEIELRHSVAVALGKLGDMRVLDMLLDYLRAGQEDTHDGDALWALAGLEEAAVAPVRSVTRDGSHEARVGARWVLETIRYKRRSQRLAAR